MPIRPRKFAHVVDRTRRFEEMLKWYTAVFGATMQYENPVLASGSSASITSRTHTHRSAIFSRTTRT